ncbi:MULTISPECIES: helix-turn-helix transcriptional regulator [unclassified Amycolatopsis]|uniref:helix-turn-helix domain-containing protein n=1 Tax=unclassified Amycolatopsis TaxID=2618356 RepID=UPI00106E0497|nr:MULTISPECIES: helix-turn-helix transcriptional regulator [unclassified Amycolatopsis]
MRTLARATPPGSVALGLELRAARVKAKFGVRELARRAGVHPGQVSSWEVGERIPPSDSVSFLAGLLHMTMTEHRRIRQRAADARREDHVEPDQDAAARLRTAYDKLASRIVEWAPVSLPDRLQRPDFTSSGRYRALPLVRRAPQPDDPQAIRDLFVSRKAIFGQTEQLLRLVDGPERIRLVTSEVGDLPAFTVYQIDGKTPTVALRHAHCSVYLTSDLATAAYVRAMQRFREEALSPTETAYAVEMAFHDVKTNR